MHHLTKIITDGMSALLYVLCVQFSSFLLWCQCRLANQIRQFIKCCGVQIHLPCISGLALYHGFQDENPRETESNVVVIVYNCSSNLRYQNQPPESKAYFTNICFWKKKSALQAMFLSCCLLSFPGRSPLTSLLLICSWPTLTIALLCSSSLAHICSTMADFVQAVFEEISLERNPALWQSEKDSRYLFRTHMSHKNFHKTLLWLSSKFCW